MHFLMVCAMMASMLFSMASGLSCPGRCFTDPKNQIVTLRDDGKSATVELLNCFEAEGSTTEKILVAPDTRKCTSETTLNNVPGMMTACRPAGMLPFTM